MDASRYISKRLIGWGCLLTLMSAPALSSSWQKAATACGGWLPHAEEVEWGQVLRQSRTCRTDFVRHRNGQEQTRFTEKVSWRTALGQRDRLLGVETATEWAPWQVDWSSLADCDTPGDLTARIDYHAGFTTLTQCQARQTRRLPVVERWLSGKEVRLPAQEQSETRRERIYLADTALGQHDRWLPAHAKYTAWKTARTEVNCSPWSDALQQAATEQLWGDALWVARTCENEQRRTVKQIRKSLSGRTDVVASKTEQRQEPVLQWQPMYGQKDEVIAQHWEQASDWQYKQVKSCQRTSLAQWMPFEQPYQHVSECSGEQVQTFYLVSKYRSGAVEVHDIKENARDATWFEITTDMGQQDNLLQADAQQRSSDWVNDGTERCQAWSPTVYAVDKGTVFVQTQGCEQAQRQFTESLSRWTSGDKWSTVSQQRRLTTRTGVRLASGEKRVSLALPAWTIDVTDGQNQMGGVHTVADKRAFDRVRVSVVHDSSTIRPKVSVVTPNGQVLELPPVPQGERNYYFNVADYTLRTDGDWHVLVAVPEGSDEHTVRVEVLLEKR
jgi:hypothetical protein